MPVAQLFSDPAAKKAKADKKALDNALQVAVLSDDVENARKLIEKGGQAKAWVLQNAVYEGRLGMYKMLREKGVDFLALGREAGKIGADLTSYEAKERVLASELRIETLEQQVKDLRQELEALRPKPETRQQQPRKPFAP